MDNACISDAASKSNCKRSRPPAEAASIAQRSRLLRYAFDSVRTESRILFADFPVFLVFLRIAPGLKFFDAVPDLHDDAPFWRLSLEHSDFSSLNKGAPAGCLGPGRSARDVLLRVSRRVRYVDLHDVVDGRLGLSVKTLDRYGAESETGDDCQRYCVLSFHACILLVWLRTPHALFARIT